MGLDAQDFLSKFEDVGAGIGNFIADGEPTSEVGKGFQAAARGICASYSNAPSWIKDKGPQQVGAIDAMCQPYLEKNGSGGPIIGDSPLVGGQCPGVGYRLEWTFAGETANYTTSISVGGPLSIYLETGPELGNGKRFYNWILSRPGPDGSPSLSSLGAEQASNPPVLTATATRLDGLPDECGNQEGEIEPNPNPLPDPNLPLDEQPVFLPNGGVKLPIPPIRGPFGIPIILPPFPIPDFLNPFNDSPMEVVTPTPGEPGLPSETGETGQQSGGDLSKELVGVLVELVQASLAPRRQELMGGKFLHIGAVYVHMGFFERLDMSEEARSCIFPQFFFAEPGSTHWRVIAAPGYNLRVTPYFRERKE